MKPVMSNMLTFTLALLCLSGCSVKEDRSVCPCRLILDFSDVDISSIGSVDLSVTTQDGFEYADEVDSDAFANDYMVSVPRRLVLVTGWAGTDGCLSEDGVLIPYGSDSPPVYLHLSSVDADCEEVNERIVMHKNYCHMTINMKGEETDSPVLILSSNVNGYEKDGRPSQGDFRYEVSPDEDRAACLDLPRQVDDSLILEIDDGTGVVKRFPLGEYVAESGYDWTAPDLDDITIDLDLAVTHVSLTIQGWETEHKFDVVI